LNSVDRRLQEIKHLSPGSVILSKLNYTYDAVGSIKTWAQQYGTNPAKVYELAYDLADQLCGNIQASVTILEKSALGCPLIHPWSTPGLGHRPAMHRAHL
jgi:hypothetical protein